MAEFKFNCPQCGQEIEADEVYRGQVAACPYCGKGIVVPRIAPKNPSSRSRSFVPIGKRYSQPSAAQPPKHSNRKLIVWIAIGAACLSVMMSAAFYLGKYSKRKQVEAGEHTEDVVVASAKGADKVSKDSALDMMSGLSGKALAEESIAENANGEQVIKPRDDSIRKTTVNRMPNDTSETVTIEGITIKRLNGKGFKRLLGDSKVACYGAFLPGEWDDEWDSDPTEGPRVFIQISKWNPNQSMKEFVYGLCKVYKDKGWNIATLEFINDDVALVTAIGFKFGRKEALIEKIFRDSYRNRLVAISGEYLFEILLAGVKDKNPHAQKIVDLIDECVMSAQLLRN